MRQARGPCGGSNAVRSARFKVLGRLNPEAAAHCSLTERRLKLGHRRHGCGYRDGGRDIVACAMANLAPEAGVGHCREGALAAPCYRRWPPRLAVTLAAPLANSALRSGMMIKVLDGLQQMRGKIDRTPLVLTPGRQRRRTVSDTGPSAQTL